MSDLDRRLEDALRNLPAEAYDGAAPPPLDLDRALRARPAARAAPKQTAPPLRRRPRWLAFPLVLRPAAALACAGVLLVVGLAAGLLVRGGGGVTGPGPRAALVPSAGGWPVALDPLPADAGAQRAQVDLPMHTGGTVDVRVTRLAPSPRGTYYELWLMTDDRRLASVGTFTVGRGGRAHVRFAVGADPHAYRYVDISLERDDGDPRHSGRSVLRSGTLS